jgi:uncharacterized paraquat-inducible protein A
MSRLLRCHECKTTTTVPDKLASDPVAHVYCHRCNRSRMLMFWIDLSDQDWAKEELEKRETK